MLRRILVSTAVTVATLATPVPALAHPGHGHALPASCAAIRTAFPHARDGEYLIFPAPHVVLGVYCATMATTPTEYVTLRRWGPGHNYAQYTARGASPGTDVITRYHRIRINPVPVSLTPPTFTVNIADQRFATSTGQLCHASTATPCPAASTVTAMPYGVAFACDQAPDGKANLDLRGTRLAVVNSFVLGGFTPTGTTTATTAQVVNLTGGGFCGWNGPAPLYNPYNDNPRTDPNGGWDLRVTVLPFF